jgi:hypothetical protein
MKNIFLFLVALALTGTLFSIANAIPLAQPNADADDNSVILILYEKPNFDLVNYVQIAGTNPTDLTADAFQCISLDKPQLVGSATLAFTGGVCQFYDGPNCTGEQKTVQDRAEDLTNIGFQDPVVSLMCARNPALTSRSVRGLI